jgi:hypothetical protein
MNAPAIDPQYTALLKKVPPKITRTEEENQYYTKVLYDGKREMNKQHIKRLSARFHVSPELFF